MQEAAVRTIRAASSTKDIYTHIKDDFKGVYENWVYEEDEGVIKGSLRNIKDYLINSRLFATGPTPLLSGGVINH